MTTTLQEKTRVINSGLLRMCCEMVQNEVVSNRDGDQHNIIYLGDFVIKYPIINESLKRERLEGEFKAGKILASIGINVPEMHKFYPGNDDESAFIIMEKLNYIDPSDLSKEKFAVAVESYKNQISIMEREGYDLLDHFFPFHNCGWDLSKQRVCFFDLESFFRKSK